MCLSDNRAFVPPAGCSLWYITLRAEQIEQMHSTIRAVADPRHANRREHGAAERQRSRHAVSSGVTGGTKQVASDGLEIFGHAPRSLEARAIRLRALCVIAADRRRQPKPV